METASKICREQVQCRVSGSRDLVEVVHLGEHALSGVFPASRDDDTPSGPLELVWCPDSGLLQLRHTYDPELMYGENYGYRSGLNGTMVRHLESKAAILTATAELEDGDVVIDIGSNDATLLKAYRGRGLKKIGVDPTGEKFREFYTNDIELVPDFFSTDSVSGSLGGKRAKLVTSIAMFYDLEDPVSFAQQVHDVLADDGIWHFEQSYMPSMLRANSYDTICHEHIEYYSLTAVIEILRRAELEVIDVVMNDVNGGSFAVTAAKTNSSRPANRRVVEWVAEQEKRMGLHTPQPFFEFESRIVRHREDLTRLVRYLRDEGKRIVGYGASTKGNVLLQFCGFTSDDIECIAEVNPDKFGCYTPGTRIPIVSEEEARALRPDYFLVLPWHFRSGIIQRETDFFSRGGRMIFPLPEIQIV